MALIGQAVSEKKIFENGGRRTPDHGHPISSPCEPDGSGELKMYRLYRKILGSFQGGFEIFLKKGGILDKFYIVSSPISWSLPEDEGGITCMNISLQQVCDTRSTVICHEQSCEYFANKFT